MVLVRLEVSGAQGYKFVFSLNQHQLCGKLFDSFCGAEVASATQAVHTWDHHVTLRSWMARLEVPRLGTADASKTYGRPTMDAAHQVA